MKKLFSTVVLGVLVMSMAWAQPKRSTIQFRLTDNDLIRVAVNGRFFNKTARSITVGAIPGKKQEVKLYRFRPYANKKGGKAELIFSGRIKIEKGESYQAVVDPKTGKLYLTKVSELQERVGQLPSPGANRTLSENEDLRSNPDVGDALRTTPSVNLSPALQKLGKEMQLEVTDGKKLQKALSYLDKQNRVSSMDTKIIIGWLLFDENRLAFIKKAYPKLSDEEEMDEIRMSLSDAGVKSSFEQFLQSRK